MREYYQVELDRMRELLSDFEEQNVRFWQSTPESPEPVDVTEETIAPLKKRHPSLPSLLGFLKR